VTWHFIAHFPQLICPPPFFFAEWAEGSLLPLTFPGSVNVRPLAAPEEFEQPHDPFPYSSLPPLVGAKLGGFTQPVPRPSFTFVFPAVFFGSPGKLILSHSKQIPLFSPFVLPFPPELEIFP